MIKFSIIIPCYNEEKNIPLILERLNNVIKRDDIEVILVNNGSTDNSQKIFDELLPKYNFAKLAVVEKNQGYGYGILFGLKQARGDYIGWTHADMQTDPNDCIKSLEFIEAEGNPKNIFVKGVRKGRSIFDNIFTVGMSIFETIYLGKVIYEVNAQPNFFHRSFFELWRNPPYDFALDLYAYYMAKKHKLKIIRFPVLFPKRIHGTSHWNYSLAGKWKFIKRTLEFSFKLKKTL